MLKLISIENDFDIVGFYTAFKFSWDETFAFNGESHNFWEAVFVESGTVEITEDENTYTLSEGNLIFHAPMEFHRIRSSLGCAPKVFVSSFKISGELPEVIKAGVFTLSPPQRQLLEEFRECVYDFVNKEPSRILGAKAEALLKLLIIKITDNSIVASDYTSYSALEYKKIISFMTNNILKNMTLEYIAQQTNISISYMKFLFNRYAGISPKMYFNLLRIRHATELLNIGHSVAYVSSTMNFSSSNYFSVFFKRHTGISPSQQYQNVQNPTRFE